MRTLPKSRNPFARAGRPGLAHRIESGKFYDRRVPAVDLRLSDDDQDLVDEIELSVIVAREARDRIERDHPDVDKALRTGVGYLVNLYRGDLDDAKRLVRDYGFDGQCPAVFGVRWKHDMVGLVHTIFFEFG